MTTIGSPLREARILVSEGRGRLLFPIALGWGMLTGTRMIYPILLPHFQLYFDISLAEGGFLLTLIWLGSALGQLPGGILADRKSERTLMVASVLVVATALVVVVTAREWLVLLVGTACVGLGQSLYPVARMTFLSTIYPDRIGSALGVTMAFADIGQTVLPPVASLLAFAIAWQFGLGFTIPCFVLIAIIIWKLLPTPETRQSAVDDLSWETGRYVLVELRDPSVLLMVVVLFLFISIWQAFSGFYPTYLVEVKGLSPSAASVLFALFFAFGIVVKPLSGSAYDQIGLRTSLLVVLGGPMIGLAMLPTIEGFWPLVAVTLVVSMMLGAGPISQSYLIDTFPADMRGTGLGALRSLVATLAALSPLAFGVVADLGYFQEGFFGLAVITGVIIVLVLRFPRG